MVIDNRQIVGVAVTPRETDPPLIVDADAVLRGSIAAQFLKAVAGRDAKIVESLRRVDRNEFAKHRAPQLGRESAHWLAGEEAFGVAVAKALDHRSDVNATR